MRIVVDGKVSIGHVTFTHVRSVRCFLHDLAVLQVYHDETPGTFKELHVSHQGCTFRKGFPTVYIKSHETHSLMPSEVLEHSTADSWFIQMNTVRLSRLTRQVFGTVSLGVKEYCFCTEPLKNLDKRLGPYRRVKLMTTSYDMYPLILTDVFKHPAPKYISGSPKDLKEKFAYSFPQPWVFPTPDQSGQRAATALKKLFPDVMDSKVICPACSDSYKQTVWSTVIHLNDSHYWTLPQIADWLDKLAEERGWDLSFPTPENIPEEPGEQKMKESLEES